MCLIVAKKSRMSRLKFGKEAISDCFKLLISDFNFRGLKHVRIIGALGQFNRSNRNSSHFLRRSYPVPNTSREPSPQVFAKQTFKRLQTESRTSAAMWIFERTAQKLVKYWFDRQKSSLFSLQRSNLSLLKSLLLGF